MRFHAQASDLAFASASRCCQHVAVAPLLCHAKTVLSACAGPPKLDAGYRNSAAAMLLKRAAGHSQDVGMHTTKRCQCHRYQQHQFAHAGGSTCGRSLRLSSRAAPCPPCPPPAPAPLAASRARPASSRSAPPHSPALCRSEAAQTRRCGMMMSRRACQRLALRRRRRARAWW